MRRTIGKKLLAMMLVGAGGVGGAAAAVTPASADVGTSFEVWDGQNYTGSYGRFTAGSNWPTLGQWDNRISSLKTTVKICAYTEPNYQGGQYTFWAGGAWSYIGAPLGDNNISSIKRC
ncbi:peptidase inhibitor family I36 protein [Micromonospora lupini]|uniref:peptidase inhibitor family I36 protein n=1 Tax=Micromonospora lupini TaxID=285679 RepID=UPI0033E7C8E0